MVLKTPTVEFRKTQELLRSLHQVIERVRKQAERLADQLSEEVPMDMNAIQAKIEAVETLIRVCRRVESSIVDFEKSGQLVESNGATLELDAAREEIERRLARLATSLAPPEVPKDD